MPAGEPAGCLVRQMLVSAAVIWPASRWAVRRGGLLGTVSQAFTKSIASLDQIFSFVDASLAETSVDERTRMILHLAAEELFTNMVKYNTGDSQLLAVRVTTDGDHVELTLVDPDTDPFDPTRLGPVDTTAPIEERKRGGLGIHLVRTMVDSMDYDYDGREMTLSVTTYLE